MVAARIARQYGQDLFRFCHMGKETSVYTHALYTCLTAFIPDFRGLLDNAPIFHSAKHISKMGLEAMAPGLLTQDQDHADNFMKARNAPFLTSFPTLTKKRAGLRLALQHGPRPL